MLRTLVHLQLAAHGLAELRLRQHPLDRLFEDQLRTPLQTLQELFFLHAAGIAGIVVILLFVSLQTGNLDVLGVDHNHVIASVDKRRVLGVVLAAQDARDAGRQTTQRLPIGINDKPLTRNFPFREIRGHLKLSQILETANEYRWFSRRAGRAQKSPGEQTQDYRSLKCNEREPAMSTHTTAVQQLSY